MNKTRQLIQLFEAYSVPLIVGVLAGLAVANINNGFYKELVDYHVFGTDTSLFGRPVTAEFLINEIFMVFFFGIAAKEITTSVLPGGALNPIGKAINPLFGTLGGVLGPAGLYFLLTFAFFGGTDNFSEVAGGWGIPTATDIALAWLVARMVFGNGHPAVNFLLLLAVADDAIGLGIIAVFYPDPDHPVTPIWLLLTVVGMFTALTMRRRKVNHWVPYIVIAGIMSWVGMIKASIEPALALVAVVPFLPSASGALAAQSTLPNPADVSHTGALSPLERFEHQTKGVVDMGLFFFAFANAGVPFGGVGSVTLIVLLSLVVGKCVGISLFSRVATRMGFPLPSGMGTKHLLVAALVAGLGLTVALFVAAKAFSGSSYEDPAKMGAVFSGGVAFLTLGIGYFLKVKDGGSSSST